ncbi:MAG: hypothetical protein GY842_04020 [bacterium]|nr:hypothetical protein [bacterium]
MSKRVCRIMRGVALALVSSLPFYMAPCDSPLQHPTPPTQTYLGVALDLP